MAPRARPGAEGATPAPGERADGRASARAPRPEDDEHAPEPPPLAPGAKLIVARRVPSVRPPGSQHPRAKSEPPRKRSRLVRFATGALASVVVTTLFAAASAVGFALHLDRPASRRVLASTIGYLYSGAMQGRLEVVGLSHLSPRHLEVDELHLYDDQDREVVTLNGVRVRADLVLLGKDALFGGANTSLVINHIRADRTAWHILPNTDGDPSLVAAMSPKPKASKGGTSSGPSRHIRVWIPTIELGQTYVRGQLGDLPTLDLTLVSAKGTLVATPDALTIDVSRFGVTLRGLAGADAIGTGDFHVESPGAIWGHFNGQLGDVELGAFFKSEGGDLDARLDLPKATPEAMRALIAEWPLHDVLSGRVLAAGTLPKLETQATLKVGQAEVEASGPITLAPELGLDLTATFRKVDLRSVVKDAPETRIDATSTVQVWNRAGEMVVDVNARTQPTEIAGVDVPLIDWNASFDKLGFRGKSTIHEPGVPIRGDFLIHPSGRVDLDLRARRFALTDSPRFRSYARGFLDVSVRGSIERGVVKASVDATAEDLSATSVRLGRGRLTGNLSGPVTRLEALTLGATLTGSSLSAAPLAFDRVEARASGRLLEPRLKVTLSGDYRPTITARGKLSPPLRGQPTRLADLEVDVVRDETTLVAKAKSLSVTERRIALQDLSLTGAGGELTASAVLTDGALRGAAEGRDVDLSAISHAIGLPRRTLEGKLSISGDFELAEAGSRGQLNLAVTGGALMGVEGVSLTFQGRLNEDSLEGNGHGEVANLGALSASFKADLPKDVLSPRAWLGVTGTGKLHAKELNLDAAALPLATYGVHALTGKGEVMVDLRRDDPAHLPSVFFITQTHDLSLSLGNGGDEPLSFTGIDLGASGTIDSATGRVFTTVNLRDRGSLLATLTGTTTYDFDQALANGGRTAIAQLLDAPVEARLSIPTRRIQELPPLLQPKGLQGSVGADLWARGQVKAPVLDAVVFASGARPESSRLAQPFNTTVRATYDSPSGDFQATAELTLPDASGAARRVAYARSSGHAPWSELLAGRSFAGDWWRIGGRLDLVDLPLQAFAPFADDHIAATLSGSVSVQRWQGLPLFDADVRVISPVIDRVALGSGRIRFKSTEDAQAVLRMEDGQGHVEAKVSTALAWPELLPGLDPRGIIQVDVAAKNYDAVVLQPLLTGLFGQVGGRVDAKLKATIRREEDPIDPSASTWGGAVNGSATVREGLLQITTLGLTLEDVRLNIAAKSDDAGTSITLSGLKAKVRSDKDNVHGRADLRLDGLALDRGAGWLQIDQVPLLLEGVSQGTGSGYAEFTLERQEDAMELAIDLQRLEARLPRSSSRSVYPVEDNPNVHVMQLIREPRESKEDNPTLWIIPIKLGREVRVTRSDMEVYVRGEPVVYLERKLSLEGFIEVVPGGRIPAVGKAFVIESGMVSFDTDDPTDPHLNATASWRAADGTTVYVDVRGTLKNATLNLRSDPPLPEPEIIALMLGGVSTTGEASQSQGGADGGSTGSAAVNLGGGVAALGLNELLADTPLGGVELRTDTTSKAAPSYTAAYRASSTIYFEGTYQSADNSGIDDTVKEGFTGTVDYRFLPNWSLRTQIGNTGTAMDLIWQYRY
ncbi:MAG: translocation/assembly module TamB domain-containing protein [Polyangiaceae bacterium]|nr:translocation/assembly module TamB domain-containing protein [Polyangiaceae bacterium]MCW5790664.1 translocation/assembly module TamB domain-containing protein [Polyangiaceae bacterium]